MKDSRKLKINLTIDSGVIAKAKKLLQARGKSVSSVVEEFLISLNLEAQDQQSDSLLQNNWLNKFHEKYLKNKLHSKTGSDEPSEDKLDELLAARAKKYS